MTLMIWCCAPKLISYHLNTLIDFFICRSTRVFGFAFMDMASPECAYETRLLPWGRWAINAALSVGILVPYLLKFLTFDIIGCGDSDKTVSATATMFSIIYVFAVTKAIEPFVCTKSSDGNWKSSLAPKSTCSFDTKWMMLASAGAFLCFVFIVV